MQTLAINILKAAAQPHDQLLINHALSNVFNLQEENRSKLDVMGDKILFARQLWLGFHSGLYNKKKSNSVPKPGENCLSNWIVEDIKDLQSYKQHFQTDFFGTPVSESEKAWYAAGNLMFKNFDECHFKAVMEDINAYCSLEEHPDDDVHDDAWD